MATAYVAYLQGSKMSECLERTSTDLDLKMSATRELLLSQKVNLEQDFQDIEDADIQSPQHLADPHQLLPRQILR